MNTYDERRLGAGRRMEDFERCPKFNKHELTEEQLVDIARRAVILAKDEFYKDVGRSVTNKMLIVVGLVSVAALQWLTSHGYLK